MEYPNAPYDELLRAANMEGGQPCSEPIILPGDWYRPTKKEAGPGKGAMNRMRSSGLTSTSADDKGMCKLPFGTAAALPTEYQDGVSKLGAYIIKEGLHTHPRLPGRLKDAFTLVKNPVRKN